MHEERVVPGRSNWAFMANIDDLSSGVFVNLSEIFDQPNLLSKESSSLGRPPVTRDVSQGSMAGL